MAGMAADMRNETRDAAGRSKLITAVKKQTPDAWIEDVQNECKLACVHADWRAHPLLWVH
jgi:hypothetical protein